MNFMQMFLDKLGDRKLFVEPSSVAGMLASTNADVRSQGVAELTKLLSSLVKFYKGKIFPLIRDSIKSIADDVKEDIAEALSYGVSIRTLFIEGSIASGIRDIVIASSASPVGRLNVSIGNGKIRGNVDCFTAEAFGYLNQDRKTKAIDTLNKVIDGSIDIDDIIIGNHGNTTFSDIVAIINYLGLEEAPEGTMGRMEDYRTVVATLRNNFNYYANKVVTAITRAVEANDLVFRHGDSYVTCYAPVLDSYYEQGGTIEALYGFHLSGAKTISLQAILDKKDLFSRQYEGEYKRLMLSKKSIARDTYIREYTEFVASYVRANELSGNLINTINTHLSTLSDLELSNVKERVEEIVVDYFYPESGARRFINSVNFFKKDMRQIEEVIGLAVMDLAVDYVVDNIHVQ